ncbi:MAG: hypothetical protein ABJL57_09400 [Hyphomonas sp.]|uniref:hypothetical protein n=1 Tax=Hyphomonas sp. TaxID=87 RepID=UPI00329A72B1
MLAILTLDHDAAALRIDPGHAGEKRLQTNADCYALSYKGALDAKLHFDPLGRLYRIEGYNSGVSQGAVRMLYDGDAMAAEYNGAGTMLRRYVHGTNADADDPLIW